MFTQRSCAAFAIHAHCAARLFTVYTHRCTASPFTVYVHACTSYLCTFNTAQSIADTTFSKVQIIIIFINNNYYYLLSLSKDLLSALYINHTYTKLSTTILTCNRRSHTKTHPLTHKVITDRVSTLRVRGDVVVRKRCRT